jgi:hypothetical protein
VIEANLGKAVHKPQQKRGKSGLPHAPDRYIGRQLQPNSAKGFATDALETCDDAQKQRKAMMSAPNI